MNVWTRLMSIPLLLVGLMASPAAMADPVAAARRAHGQASTKVQAGDIDGAIKIYKKALIFAPAYPLALNELGVLLLKKGEFEEARSRLAQAVEWMPDFLPAWSNLGEAERQLGNEEGVILAYGQVLRIAPLDATAWYGLALGLVDDGEREEARGALERYLEIAPAEHPLRGDAQTALDALIAMEVDAEDPQLPASAPFGPKPPPDPADLPLPPFVSHPGDDAYAAHRFMEALNTYQSEAMTNPKDAVLLYKIGVVHAVMGDYLNARRWWGKSVIAAPDRQFFLRHAAMAALTRARHKETEEQELKEATAADTSPAGSDEPEESPEDTGESDDDTTVTSPDAPDSTAEPAEPVQPDDTKEDGAGDTSDVAETPVTEPAPPLPPVELARQALLNRNPSFAWVTLQGVEGPEGTYLRAEAALRMGNFAEARDTFRAAADQASSSDVGPWGGLAEALVRLGDKEAAAGAIRDWLDGREIPEGEFLLLRTRAAQARIRNGPPTPPTPDSE